MESLPQVKFPVLRELTGQEKKDATSFLVNLTEKGTTIQKYKASILLGEESARRKRQYEVATEFWSDKTKSTAILLVAEYREELKRKIITKHFSDLRLGKETPEMKKDFLMLENLQTNACFSITIDGVSHKDCKTCSRNCTSRSKEKEKEEITTKETNEEDSEIDEVIKEIDSENEKLVNEIIETNKTE